MPSIEHILKSIDAITKDAQKDDLKDIPKFPGIDKVPGYVETFEKKIAKLLRKERKKHLTACNKFTSKDDSPIEALLNYLEQDLFASQDFQDQLSAEAQNFLQLTVEELAKIIMESIDKDIPFERVSKQTTKWIESWSKDLAELMDLHTHDAIKNVLTNAMEDGSSIQDVELKLSDLPEFDRKRARTTAITETLTASSRAQWEAYNQSPSVTKKKWKHSGTKKNKPRENHVELDGTEVRTDEEFAIPESEETCQFPRDPVLSAKERVNCHCVLGPVVDEEIIGLSKEEKEKLRKEALKEMDKEE